MDGGAAVAKGRDGRNRRRAPFGIAVAWCWRARSSGKSLLNGIVHMPLVLPPVVTGYLLLIGSAGAARSARSSTRTSASCSRSAGPARRSPAG